MTIEDLAMLVKKGFDDTASKDELRDFKREVDRRFEQVDKQIGGLTDILAKFIKATDDNFRHVNARLDTLSHDISDVPTMREELRHFRTRLERLERKV